MAANLVRLRTLLDNMKAKTGTEYAYTVRAFNLLTFDTRMDYATLPQDINRRQWAEFVAIMHEATQTCRTEEESPGSEVGKIHAEIQQRLDSMLGVKEDMIAREAKTKRLFRGLE